MEKDLVVWVYSGIGKDPDSFHLSWSLDIYPVHLGKRQITSYLKFNPGEGGRGHWEWGEDHPECG